MKADYDAARAEASAIRDELYAAKALVAAELSKTQPNVTEAEIVRDPRVANVQARLDAKNKEIDSKN